MQNHITEVETSFSLLINSINTSINSHNENLQQAIQRQKEPSLDAESKLIIKASIDFLKFHIGELENIVKQISLAQNTEASFALSSDGQIIH